MTWFNISFQTVVYLPFQTASLTHRAERRSATLRQSRATRATRAWVTLWSRAFTRDGAASQTAPYKVISYKFAKGFLAITFLLLIISSWNFHDVCQDFLCSQKQNSSWIRHKTKNFPIYPHCKNRPLWLRHVYRHDVAKVIDFYNGGGSMGNFLIFCRVQLKFRFWLHKKRCHTLK